MQRSPYFIRWFPSLLIISLILILYSYTQGSFMNHLVEQILEYLSFLLIGLFIFIAYKKERSLVVPRRKFWIIAFISLIFSLAASIFETINLFSNTLSFPNSYSLICFSISHYIFLIGLFYRIASQKSFSQHLLAFMDALIIVVFLGLAAFHTLSELADPTASTFPYDMIVVLNTSLGLFVFFYFFFVQETHWVSRTTLSLLFLSLFIRGMYEVSAVYFPDFTEQYLVFSPVLIRLAQSAAILWHLDHITEGKQASPVVQRTWLPLLAIPLFLHYVIELEGKKFDVFIILLLLIIRQIIIARQHTLLVQKLNERNEQLAERIEHRIRQIKESEQQVLPLFSSHPDPIIRFDQNETATYANLAAQATFKLSALSIEVPTHSVLHLQSSLQLDSNRYLDESNRQYELTKIPIHIASKSVGHFLVLHDITEQKERQQRIEYHAFHDVLTGIGNRRSLERTFLSLKSSVNYLALLDLDGFKLVNDTYGHEAGDYVLIEVARRMDHELECDESIYRLGGDEFALLTSAEDEFSLRRRCKHFLHLLRRPYVYKGQTLHVSASIGVAPFFENDDLESWLKHADLAMYRIKNREKNDIALYHQDF